MDTKFYIYSFSFSDTDNFLQKLLNRENIFGIGMDFTDKICYDSKGVLGMKKE